MQGWAEQVIPTYLTIFKTKYSQIWKYIKAGKHGIQFSKQGNWSKDKVPSIKSSYHTFMGKLLKKKNT